MKLLVVMALMDAPATTNFVEKKKASLFRFGFASSSFVKLIELHRVGVFGVFHANAEISLPFSEQ